MVRYFYKIREIHSFVTRAGNPISDNNVIAELYLVMAHTGIFDKAINDWDELPAADRTWARFQTHFKTAYRHYKDCKKRERAAGGGNSRMANQAWLIMQQWKLLLSQWNSIYPIMQMQRQ